MARLFVTDSGAVERELARLFVIDSGGTAREIQRLFAVDSGGTARLVFEALVVSLSHTGSPGAFTFNGSASATISVTRSGVAELIASVNKVGDISGWADPASATIGDGYDVRLTVNSGDSPTSGSATGSWLALSSDRSWTWATGAAPDSLTANVTLEIKKTGGGAAIATDTFGIDATASIV